MTPRSISRFLCSLAVLAVPAVARAQTGAVAGRVTDSTTAAPLPGATVRVLAGTNTVGQTTTGDDGAYRVGNLAAGTYTVNVTRLGFSVRRIAGVQVSEGQTAQLDVRMTEIVTQLNPAVVTASRREEKILEAPASISVVETREIEERPAITVADHLRGVQGVDATTGGIAQTNIVTRGFNNAFSGSLLTLQDYRFAAVPSLRVNVPLLFTGTNEDIERMEVLLGPASALYGPNSANGVLHVITKSPFSSQGTTLSLEGGERSIMRGAVRHANALGERFGYKLSGEYFTGKDFEFDDPAEPNTFPASAPPGRAGQPVRRDFDVERFAGEARMDIRPFEGLELITTYGLSRIGNGLELTGTNGTAQAKNWTYQSLQQRVRFGDLFVQAFMNFSDAGNENAQDLDGTYLLRTGVPIVDNSRVYAAQVQHSLDLFDERESLVYGVDYIFTNPRTGNTINGRNEDDDDVTEVGAYVQSTTRLTPMWDLVGALRVDNHSVLDQTYWSPRVGVVFKPRETHNIRATYNRAFSTPANFSFFLDLPQASLRPAVPYDIRGLGVPSSGFSFRRNCTTGVGQLCMRSPFPVVGANPAGPPAVPVNTVVDANAAQYYRTFIAGQATQLGSQLVAAGVTPQNAQIIIGALLAANPTPAQVSTQLRLFRPPNRANPQFAFVEVDPSSIQDLSRLKATITDQFEVGYKGILGNRARLAVDLWYARKQDFTTAAQNVTPNAFMNGQQLGAFVGGILAQQAAAGRIPPAAVQPLATSIATALAQIPVGTVVPESPLANTPDLFFSYRNIEETIDLYGTDLAVDYLLSDRFSVIGTYSWVSDVVFPEIVSGIDTLLLNSPDHKATLTGRYRDEAIGVSFELRGRYQNAYSVNSGVYVGDVPVNAFLDASFAWRLPIQGQNVTWSISGTNITNNKRITFVGTPEIGRMLLTKVQYTF
jgi:outer membrane receptor for ferrienterochelin and colicins